MIHLSNSGQTIELREEFRPGAIVVVEADVHSGVRQALNRFEEYFKEYSSNESDFHRILSRLRLIDLNRMLYRSSGEEQSDGKGFDVYSIPNYGPMVYAGIQEQISLSLRSNSSTGRFETSTDHEHQTRQLVNRLYFSTFNRSSTHQSSKSFFFIFLSVHCWTVDVFSWVNGWRKSL